MTDRGTARPWARVIVVLLTLAWLVLLLALAYGVFAAGMESWADHHSNNGEGLEEIGKRSTRLVLGLALALPAGPALAAAVAFAGRLHWTGVVYAVLAVLLCVPAAPLAAASFRELNPPAPVPTTYVCQERSGGDTDCPGG